MPLDPQAQDFLRRLAAANLPSFQEQTVAQLRAQMDMSTHFLGELPRVAHVEDRGIPGPGGTLRVRIITPQAAGNGLLPVLVYFHGGGWVLGDIESHEGICRALANAGGVIVVNGRPPLKAVQVSGRREDAYCSDYAGPQGTPFRIRGDPGRIAVAGDTRGQSCRRDVPDDSRSWGMRLDFRPLLENVTDCDISTGSYPAIADGFFLNRSTSLVQRTFRVNQGSPALPMLRYPEPSPVLLSALVA